MISLVRSHTGDALLRVLAMPLSYHGEKYYSNYLRDFIPVLGKVLHITDLYCKQNWQVIFVWLLARWAKK